jgi:hypothetical protein
MSKFKVGDTVRVTTQEMSSNTWSTFWDDDEYLNDSGDLVGVVTFDFGFSTLGYEYEVKVLDLSQTVTEHQIELYKPQKESNVQKVPYTVSDGNISVFVDGQMFNIPVTDKTYQKVRDLIEQGNHTEDNVKAVVDKIGQLDAVTEGRVSVKNNAVYLDGEMVRNSLAERLVYLIQDGFDAKPWMRFMENLSENPSYKSRESLFTFLDHFQAPITEDGCFIAFKRVRSNFKDIHTGTMDNSPGTTVSMPRDKVDDDSQRTCSSGLHACASIYLQGFGNWYDHKVVAVKINPRDVVSVPYDYGFSKMRVCQYVVLREVQEPEVQEIEESPYYEYDEGFDTIYVSFDGQEYYDI